MSKPVRLFIAGDSTAAVKGGGDKPMTGWGEYLQSYFPADRIIVDNRAVNGRSTKSFIDEGRLAHIQRDLQPGDYLFIQFGHNDGKQEDPARYTDPEEAYPANLRLFVETARQAGAHPVLLTSVSRRRYLADGSLDPQAVDGYPAAMRRAARECGVPLLDLFTASQELYNELGPEASKRLLMHLAPGEHPNYPDGVADDTHFSDEGAREMARLAAAAIRTEPLLKELAARMKRESVQTQTV
ncbi:rhamnogalacturonan acetylesterase [Paenibacillus sp. CN-4]|uniref:rhamnogalacturonan acetylesterase n=1 Tax=Paenibacillus nanchangensis TaxID=3348343 RepID=UPI00397AF89E